MQGLTVLATIVDQIARLMSRRNFMQGWKVLPTIVDENARVNKIVDGRTYTMTDGKPDTYVTSCQQVRKKEIEMYLIYSKYADTSTPYHTCPKTDRCCILQHLI